MGSQSRNQEYQYQYKSVTVANNIFCGLGPNIQVNLPDNVLKIKTLFMRVQAQVDPTETNPGFQSIILNGLPYFSSFYGSLPKTIPINWQPNVTTHIINTSIDLTGQLNNLFIFPGAAGNQPYFTISLISPNNTPYSSSTSVMTLWKLDFTYTTQGIR